MKLVAKYLSPYGKRMLLGLSIKISGTVVELFLPLILSHILDTVIKGMNIWEIAAYGALMIVLAACACICNIVANRMAAKVSVRFSQKMRQDLFEKTLSLSAKDTDRFTVPSMEARITTDTYNVHNFVGMMQRMGVRAPMLLIGGLTISFIMDAHLALVMLCMLPLIFITVFLISRKGVPLYADVQKSVDGMIRVVREDAQGIRVIKALSKNDYENRRFDKVSRELSSKEKHAGIIMGVVNPVMTLLMNLGIAGVVALSAVRVANGTSSTATVIAFMQYFTLISMAMMTLSRIFVMYTKCAASAKRIEEIMTTPDKFFVTENEKKRDTGSHIRFENVSFSYFGRRKDLDSISFDIGHGGHLGIIGSTGSGKTTLIKLLMRFYESDSGNITVNDRSITSFEKDELTAMFGVAMQNDFLYSESIAENIRFGRDISDEQIKWAAGVAQAKDFIEALPDGYDHVLTPKGTNLSGGQKQRLLIARAIAARPDIIILDDSSSALDYKTDAALRAALASELGGSTVITVAQRVSSVMSCDRIIVLEEGAMIGYGTHEQLLASCAEYREISDSQMGGAILE